MQARDQVVGVCIQNSTFCYASSVSILAQTSLNLLTKLNDSKFTNNLKMIHEGSRTNAGCQYRHDVWMFFSVAFIILLSSLHCGSEVQKENV